MSRVARMTRPMLKQWSRQMVPTLPSAARKVLPLRLVLDQLDGADEADVADLADQRVVLQLLQSLRQIGTGLSMHTVDDALVAQDADVLDGDDAGHGMAGIGEAVVEVATLRTAHRRPDRRSWPPRRQIARREPLRQRHEIRLMPEMTRWQTSGRCGRSRRSLRRPTSGSIVLATDALDLRPVGLGRNDDAARTLDRLADEGRRRCPAPSSTILSSSARAACSRTRPATARRPGHTSRAARCGRSRAAAGPAS